MAEYVAWAAGRAREAGLDHLSPFWVMEYDTVMDGLLKAHGFVPLDGTPGPPLLARSLEGDLPPWDCRRGTRCRGCRASGTGDGTRR